MKKLFLMLGSLTVIAHPAFSATFVECGKGRAFRMAAYSANNVFKGANSGIAGERWQFAVQKGRWLPSGTATAKYAKRDDILKITVAGHGGRFTIYEIQRLSSRTPELAVTHISGRATPAGSASCTITKE